MEELGIAEKLLEASMPLGTVYARGPWYPSWLRRRLQPRGKQYITGYLGRQLPVIIAYALRTFDAQSTVDESHVFVRFEKLHGDSVNAPDIWVELKLDQRFSARRDGLLTTIERQVSKALSNTCSGRTGRPIVDIDIIFVTSCGCTIDERGERTQSW